MHRPNILYLHSHDTGRYIQPYGHAIQTPALQRLAEQGMLFRQAYCTNPTCSPSRASLVTGQWAHSAGMLGLSQFGFAMPDFSRHILHTLKPAGYRTTLCGMQHIAPPNEPQRIGYDEICNTPNHPWSYARDIVPTAVDFLRTPPREPFFLNVGFSETHRIGSLPHDPFTHDSFVGDTRYCLVPPAIPDTPQTRDDFTDFKRAATILDHGIGEVLKALDESGLAGNTLVICTTDHGIAFPSMKCNLTGHGLGVMLMIRGPGGFSGGQVSDALVSHIDLFPTICEVAKIPLPSWLQGQSLCPLAQGKTDSIHDEIFSEVNYHSAYEPMRAIRTNRWSYIRRFTEDTHPTLTHCDPSLSRDLWTDHGWLEQTVASEQLYDLILDPQERCNLATDPRLDAVRKEMANRLDQWMLQTDDPLLQGPVPAPQSFPG